MNPWTKLVSRGKIMIGMFNFSPVILKYILGGHISEANCILMIFIGLSLMIFLLYCVIQQSKFEVINER